MERLADLPVDGYTLVQSAFSQAEVAAILASLEPALANDTAGWSLRSADGVVYGARNVLQLWPGVAGMWRRPTLQSVLAEALGPDYGLVRVLYFDKPPEQSWALPWHKDMTIAVKDNRRPSSRFARPTTKAGVPHIEAPVDVLRQMLTLRIHLDDVTDENGPLKVIPGSHHDDRDPDAGARPQVTILAAAGDVLAMRPLLCHCSNRSAEGTSRHRRILHLEFAGLSELPEGFAWHDFVAANG